MAEFDLAGRPGLPDGLRVLMAEYPREQWAANDRFTGLVSFWLDRHLMFRRLLERITEDGRQLVADAVERPVFNARLARMGNMLVEQLHGHHRIEDVHYFPALERMDPRLSRGFALLEADHRALDGQLESFVEAANACLQAAPSDGRHAAVGPFQAVLDDFGRLLDRHLVDEEELVVPVILKHGAQILDQRLVQR